jgi:Cu/Ag efflux pump CusA
VQERQGFPGSDSGRVATVMIGGVHTTTLFVLQPLCRLILLLKRVKILSGDR